MEFAPIVELAKPVFNTFVEFYNQAFDEFDLCIPDSIRPGVERARAKWMHCRVLALLELKYGRVGSPRMVTDKYGLTYLLIERPDLRVGIRNKKFDRHGRSQNHDSEWQDEMRRTGLFPETQAYHTFIGCRLATTFVPSISQHLDDHREQKQGPHPSAQDLDEGRRAESAPGKLRPPASTAANRSPAGHQGGTEAAPEKKQGFGQGCRCWVMRYGQGH